jgi:drug/metabolite transporter (DMT)-like permease
MADHKQISGRMTGTIPLLTLLAMVAFAANSLLARMAFQTTTTDAASFTAIRLVSGALTLLFLLGLQQRFRSVPPGLRTLLRPSRTSLLSAFLLFAYAAAFSLAYRDISTGAGALILFAAAQLTMISAGLLRGERTSPLGLLLALGGLTAFLAPSASAPPPAAAALMAVAGLAWGGFSLLKEPGRTPLDNTTASFVLALPLCLPLLLLPGISLSADRSGILFALLSGSLTSAVGYAVWYQVRVRMSAIGAGAVQLSVPIISALLGVLLLGENITLYGALSALTVLGGIAVVILTLRR